MNQQKNKIELTKQIKEAIMFGYLVLSLPFTGNYKNKYTNKLKNIQCQKK